MAYAGVALNDCADYVLRHARSSGKTMQAHHPVCLHYVYQLWTTTNSCTSA